MPDPATPANGVLFQYFHWYGAADGSLWRELRDRAGELKAAGVTAVWIPPCYKAAGGPDDVGYAVYDLFDLGEFDQKNAVRTKYGTRAELHEAIGAAKSAGLQVYADVVLNHRQGGDETEEVTAVEVDKHERNAAASAPYQMHAWTRFTFPGRGEAYSAFKWDAACFTSTDSNADAPHEDKLYLLNGKSFSGDVSAEFGNFDYLMGCDVDVNHPAVREELFYWGRWFVDVTGVDGFRLDAVKHIPASFYRDFFNHVRTHFGGRELLGVGEYWSADVAELQAYLGQTEGVMKLFDVPLHFNFMSASKGGNGFDLRMIFDKTLTQADSLSSVTFVENHDTQPGQSLQSPVEDWFKPLAYALILLRREGYPCVFYADYYGSEGEPKMVSHRTLIDAMLNARERFHFGDQHDYFDHPNCLAWVRTGNAEHPGAMVVVMSNGESGSKRANTFSPGGTFTDLTGHHGDQAITAGDDGFADFTCPAGKLSVWVQA